MSGLSFFNRSIAVVAALLAAGSVAHALDKVTMGTGWLAEAEHGGFYQALADGTYKKMGLDVTIVMGGPQVPNRAMLIAGQVQFLQGSTFGAFDAVASNIPTHHGARRSSRRIRRRSSPHPDVSISTTIADLAKLDRLYLAGDGHDTFFRWLKARYPGFSRRTTSSPIPSTRGRSSPIRARSSRAM